MSTSLTFENIDPKVRKMAMIGLALGMLVACMDGTIIGTCMNTIASDFGKDGLELCSWMVTAYLLCESAMVPIAGKMSDRFGRKPIFLLGLILFGGGSIASGLSGNIYMLIICRGIQGLGGGILMPVAMASVADFYGPEDRGKIQGALGAVFGIGSGIGPLVGGAICQYISWHWVFYINIPIIVICFFLTMKKFPEVIVTSVKKIDYIGISVLTLVILDVLLYFEWIGDKFQFLEWKSLAMIAAAIVLLVLFNVIERKADDPVVHLKLFRNKTVVKAMVYMFIMGLAMIGTLSYIAMYIINLYDLDTMKCGLCMLPMVFGMMFTSMGSGMMVKKTGYRIWVVVGSIIMVGSLIVMSTLGSNSALWTVLVYLFFFGLGLGCVNSTVMISVQNHTRHEDMGMTTSAVSLMRNIGATVGTAAYALIISNKMDTEFAKTVFAPLADIFNLKGTGLIALKYIPCPPSMPGAAQKVVELFGNGVCTAFLFAGLLYIVALIISFTMDKGYTSMDDESKEEQ